MVKIKNEKLQTTNPPVPADFCSLEIEIDSGLVVLCQK